MADWDHWIITTDERAKHDVQFQNLKPTGGYITGEQAKAFFLTSGLPVLVLGQIWALADMDADGKMNKKEFSIAMFLIQKKLSGMPLPPVLPGGLKTEPQLSIMAPKSIPSQLNIDSSGSTISAKTVQNDTASSDWTSPVTTNNGPTTQEWAITPNNRPRYKLLFNQHDRNKRGFLTGVEARGIFLQSGLSQNILAHIWSLADLDKDGNLDCEEFCIAAFLIEKALTGAHLPSILPRSLQPTMQRGSSASNAPITSTIENDGEAKEKPATLSFEDKRRENFLHGQIELDKRKQELAEKMKLEEEARLENERLEREKQEKIRLEKERQQAAEAEKQAELLRNLEAQREQRRKQAVEARMLATREAEKQRQLEYEKQRTDALRKERTQAQALLEQAIAHRASLLESGTAQEHRLRELDVRLQVAQTEVDSHKSMINEMRSQRDMYDREIRDLTEQIEAAKAELTRWQREKEQLSLRVSTGVDTNPVTEQFKTLQSNRDLRLKTMEQLRNQLNELDQRTTQQGQELATRRNKADDLEHRLTRLILDLTDVRHSVEQNFLIYKQKKSRSSNLNGAAPTNDPNQPTTYEAMFKFEARHPDELSFAAGDSVTEIPNPPMHIGPGWLYGQANGKVGLFPESYVRKKVDGKIDPFDPFGVHKAPNSSTPAIPTFADPSSFPKPDPAVCPPIPDSTTSSRPSEEKQWAEALWDWNRPHSPKNLPPDVPLDSVWSVLTANERIEVIKQSDNGEWFLGQKDTKQGWFPVSCFKFLSPVGLTDSATTNGATSTQTFVAQNNTPTPSVPTNSNGLGLTDILFSCVALYPYESNVTGDLSLAVGDLIRVTTIKDDWWEGMCERTKAHGLFPANYVRKLSTEETRLMEERLSQSANDLIEKTQPSSPSHTEPNPTTSIPKPIDVPVTATTSEESSSSGVVVCTKPEFARVIAPYKATSVGQLSLQTGQLIQLRKRSPKGWWEGEVQQRGRVRQIGWFPADYVRLITPLSVNGNSTSTDLLPDNSSSPSILAPTITTTANKALTDSPATLKATSSTMVNNNKTSEPSAQSSNSISLPAVEMMQTIFSYKAAHADELTFEEGAIITVLGRDEPEWWRGRLQTTGAEGLFPVNYVRPYNPNSDTGKSTISGSIHMTNKSPVIQPQNTPEPVTQRNLVIKELVESEFAYKTDLIEINDVFRYPIRNSGYLYSLSDIFPCWDELLDQSTKFYNDLTSISNHPERSLGAVLVKHLPGFKIYRRYCLRHKTALETLQSCLDSDVMFRQFVTQCQQNTRTKGLPLFTYLLKPMQRVTKYKLLIEKIFRNTDVTSTDRDKMAKAYELISTLLISINNSMEIRENDQIIQWLRDRLVGESGSPLTGNKFDLGAHLLLNGTLFKAKSNREFTAFLFSNYLLLTIPSQSFRSRPLDLTVAKEQLDGIFFTVYKRPLPLNQITLRCGAHNYGRSVSTCSVSGILKMADLTITGRQSAIDFAQNTDAIFSIFSTEHATRPIITLRAPSSDLSNRWISHLERAIRKAKNTRACIRNSTTDVSTSGSTQYIPKTIILTISNPTTRIKETREILIEVGLDNFSKQSCLLVTNDLLTSGSSSPLNFDVSSAHDDSKLCFTAYYAPKQDQEPIGSFSLSLSSLFTALPTANRTRKLYLGNSDQCLEIDVSFEFVM